MTISDTSDLDRKTRVVATTKLPGVPEGTAGVVGRSVGLTLTRYRVAFDNGVDLTSVTHSKLVREDEWDEYQSRREAEAEAADADQEAEEAEAADDTPSADGAESAGSGPTDDRLAALLARSKAAKAKKMGEG